MKPRLSLIGLLVLNAAAFGAAEDPNSNAANSPVINKLHHITIFVRDYDEALNWFTNKLGFAKVEDRAFGEERWLVVAPENPKDFGIVLAKPGKDATPKDLARIGATKDWVFETEDCQKAFETLQARGVHFTQTPQKMPWGTQAIFEDLYGDEFVLLSTRRR